MDEFVIRKSGEKYIHNTDEDITTLPTSTSNLEENTYKKRHFAVTTNININV